MKQAIFYFSVFASLVLSLNSCVYPFAGSISGNGNVKVEAREIGEFNSIEASNGLHVFITFGDSRTLEVEADENLHDIIRTEVTSGTLRIYTEKNIRKEKAKNIRVSVRTLEEIEVSSAADVQCENQLEADKLNISVSSAGELRLETSVKELDIDASSSGSLEIKGEAGELEAEVSSAGSIDASRLMAKYCKVSASSAGSASVWVTEKLDADASSAGNIRYKGDPANKRIDTSSAGSITQR
jgi:hypothetical protein